MTRKAIQNRIKEIETKGFSSSNEEIRELKELRTELGYRDTFKHPEDTLSSMSQNGKSKDENIKKFESIHGRKPTTLDIAKSWANLK